MIDLPLKSIFYKNKLGDLPYDILNSPSFIYFLENSLIFAFEEFK